MSHETVTIATPAVPLPTRRPRILCVDDEVQILEGLGRVLRRDFEVVPAIGGAAALARMQSDHNFAIIISDMRMPAVDGVAVLTAARRLMPEATRVLLTGQADIRSAVSAVNEGGIFRFLTKPCGPELLLAALGHALELHQRMTAERVLLAQTLTGSVQALIEVLGAANPRAFGRATRVRHLMGELAAMIGFRDRWQMEMAAMLSQVGGITLPPATAERVYGGQPLTPEDERLVTALPSMALRFLGEIPRLDDIRTILRHLPDDFEAGLHSGQDLRGEAIPLGARMLRAVLEFDRLQTEGCSGLEAMSRLRARTGAFDPDILSDLATITGAQAAQEMIELRLEEVQLGMVFMEDVRGDDGTLLVARGQEVTPHLLERIGDYWGDLQLPRPVRVTRPVVTA